MRVELLTVPGCQAGARTAALLAEALRVLAPGTAILEISVTSPEEAEALAFPGSPTVRVDGRDIDPDPPAGVGLG